MSYNKEENAAFFPVENYEALRKGTTTSSSDAVIAYKPIEAPAWDKHSTELAPKPARFSKLTRWDQRCTNLQTVVKWVVVAAGAATIAGPAIMHIPH